MGGKQYYCDAGQGCHLSHQHESRCVSPKLVEMRRLLTENEGGPTNWAFDNLVHAASEQGILSVVSAGNAGVDVNRVSPAGTSSAITVAASAANNTAWSYSNFGSKVDLYAPGVDVHSLSLEAGKDVALTGTSMSAPHVSGLVLYLKSTEPGLEAVEAVTARVLELCKKDSVVGVPEFTPNLLAYNGAA